MNDLLNKLALTELIFVGHDWGGPIGMGALERSPDLLKGAVVLNTVLDAPKEQRKLSTLLKLVKMPVVGEFMLEGFVSIFDQLPGFQADAASMPPDVIELYGKPVFDSGNAKGPLALTRLAATGPDHPSAKHFRDIETYIRGRKVPTEVVWGMKDPILAKRLPTMKTVFPNAQVTEIDAGHFLQEEAPEEIAASIMRIYGQVRSLSKQ